MTHRATEERLALLTRLRRQTGLTMIQALCPEIGERHFTDDHYLFHPAGDANRLAEQFRQAGVPVVALGAEPGKAAPKSGGVVCFRLAAKEIVKTVPQLCARLGEGHKLVKQLKAEQGKLEEAWAKEDARLGIAPKGAVQAPGAEAQAAPLKQPAPPTKRELQQQRRPDIVLRTEQPARALSDEETLLLRAAREAMWQLLAEQYKHHTAVPEGDMLEAFDGAEETARHLLSHVRPGSMTNKAVLQHYFKAADGALGGYLRLGDIERDAQGDVSAVQSSQNLMLSREHERTKRCLRFVALAEAELPHLRGHAQMQAGEGVFLF